MSKLKPFIVYLDIDGVLVSYLKLKERNPIDRKHNFEDKSVEVLNTIISMFDADICIVSTWGRRYWNQTVSQVIDSENNSEHFKEFLLGRGIIVNNLTFGDPDDRAGYVLKKKSEGYDRFLIIDDEALEYYRREEEIGFNRILVPNSWRCLDEFDLIGITRNYERINDLHYPENIYNKNHDE